MKSKTYKFPLFTLIGRCYNAAIAILFPNRYLLNVITTRTKQNRVNLHYWITSLEIGGSFKNYLGDDLSLIIVKSMLEKKGLSLDSPINGKKHLYAIGSIISMGYQNATIWGSGILQEMSWIRKLFHHYPFRRLDIRAVRGPQTRDLLLSLGHKCPEVYGDPGLLLPYFYMPKNILKDKDYIFIPHFSKENAYLSKYGSNHIVSMITSDYKKVVDNICASKKVISSSLHGIILAEAYGVPAILLRDREASKDFKYIDYYRSTLRPDYSYACSLEQAIAMEPMPLPSNINDLQRQLIETFPYDLWINNQKQVL